MVRYDFIEYSHATHFLSERWLGTSGVDFKLRLQNDLLTFCILVVGFVCNAKHCCYLVINPLRPTTRNEVALS